MGSVEIKQQFSLKDEPIDNLRPIKVRAIGAGFSGIYLGVRITQRIKNLDFQIYEKNEGVGGTWWENKYPGCACDVPAHSYQYTFEPNPHWSEFYASSTEIQAYLAGVVEKYGVSRFVKTSHKVVECSWDESAKKWNLVVENLATGETFEDDADVVVTARGTLNEPKYPKLPGMNDFKGETMHSATWNDKYDFKNKKIGLVGGGSSAVQILPCLQKIEGATITNFVRGRVWLAGAFFDSTMEKLGLDPEVLTFSEAERDDFCTDAEAYLKFRKVIEGFGSASHSLTLKDSKMQADTVTELRDYMKEKLSKKPEIAEQLTPGYAAGCRRLIPGPGYLEALVQDNVVFYADELAAVNANGIELKNGKQIDLDVIIYATGFNTAGVPSFEVTGKDGLTLRKRFSPYMQSYLSMAVDGFPNYFMMLGPNSMLGAGALTIVMEAEGDYIVKCIRKMQKEDYVSMVPKKKRVNDFSAFVEAYFKKTIYVDNCRSWYKDDAGHVIGLWPGSTTHALETLRSARWEDYQYESKDDNELRWLGNGWSVCQTGGGDPTFYLEPAFINVPAAGTPEKDPVHMKRPYSQ